MKQLFMGCFALSCAAVIFPQQYQNASDTNPVFMQWMKGFPPPAEKTLHAADGSYFKFPALRYSVNHMQEFSLTRTVSAPKKNLYKVKTKYDAEIDSIKFKPWNSD